MRSSGDVSRWAIEPAHGDRPEAEVVAGGELVVDAVDQALGGHAPVVRAMQVAVDAGGGAGGGDPAGELGRLAVEERRVVEHDDDRLHAGGQLARGGQRQVEPHQLAVVDDLIVGVLKPGVSGVIQPRVPQTTASPRSIASP